jgi:SAM-dependent methyltransferase
MFERVDSISEEELENKVKKLKEEYLKEGKITTRGNIIRNKLIDKTLDVGCDSHFLHDEIKNNDTIGLDIIIKYVRGKVIKGDAQYMPIKSESFDNIVAGEIIEHLEKPEIFLKECYRVLRKNGRLIITTPNRESWWNMITKSYFIKYHISLFTKDELISSLNKIGFSVNEFFFIPYDKFSNPFGVFYTFRKIIHHIVPKNLKENMIVIAAK